MGLINELKKIAAKRMCRTDALFSCPIQKQLEYLNGLPEPASNIERSYLQYCCQMQRIPRLDVFVQNVVGFVLFFYYGLSIPKKLRKDYECSEVDAVFFKNGLSDSILPPSVLIENQTIVTCNYEDAFLLLETDRQYIVSLWKKYPFCFCFIFKTMLKIASYRAQIERYHPKKILVSAEYSFTSSALTDYLENLGILHINVMHGEKLFTISDAFFQFSKSYVWNQHYIKLFETLRVKSEQFCVEVPGALKFSIVNIKKNCYLKYYLSNEDEENLKIIAENLKRISKTHGRIVVRMHPRFSDERIIRHIFEGIEIESNSVDIETSILSSQYVASLFSTVLNQAYYNGVNIVIDDCSNPLKYEKLKEMNYVMFDKEHTVLSYFLI